MREFYLKKKNVLDDIRKAISNLKDISSTFKVNLVSLYGHILARTIKSKGAMVPIRGSILYSDDSSFAGNGGEIG